MGDKVGLVSPTCFSKQRFYCSPPVRNTPGILTISKEERHRNGLNVSGEYLKDSVSQRLDKYGLSIFYSIHIKP